MLKAGSRSFHAASLLLPKSVRDPATVLYAFCRQADDAVDLHGGRREALAELRARLDCAYRATPRPSPVDRTFAEVVHRFAIPRVLPEALIEGLEWDAEGRRYATLSDLLSYAARVAGTVGAMMAALMDQRDPGVIARATDLGLAMQLTNIARDVGEDARAGRLYLPLAWLEKAGIDADAWLARPVFDARLGAVIEALLLEADYLYQRAASGIEALPRNCRPGIRAARAIYREIGRSVARAGYDSVGHRAFVSDRRKLSLLARAFLPGGKIRAKGGAQPETLYLVDAVAAAPRPLVGQRRSQSPPGFDGAVTWVIDLFARLEQRDRLERQNL